MSEMEYFRAGLMGVPMSALIAVLALAVYGAVVAVDRVSGGGRG